jgi:hypothetical protein
MISIAILPSQTKRIDASKHGAGQARRMSKILANLNRAALRGIENADGQMARDSNSSEFRT